MRVSSVLVHEEPLSKAFLKRLGEAVQPQLIAAAELEIVNSDPASLNLQVAQGIPALANLNIRSYTLRLDQATDRFCEWLPKAEKEFHADPANWGNDLARFRLGMLCQFIEQVMGVRYTEDQLQAEKIQYVNPGDLFVCGVMDTGQGTCGNMAVLYLSMAWRMRWPVFLAMVWWHHFCRYEYKGKAVNIETSLIGRGGYSLPADEYYIKSEPKLQPGDLGDGGNLVALRPLQMLGCFFGARARHFYDCCEAARAEEDYARACHFFPESRLWREKWENCYLLKRSGLKPPPEMLKAAGLI